MESTIGRLLVAFLAPLVIWLALTEFSYFGTPAVRLVYNRFANRYERKWWNRRYRLEAIETRLFVAPLRKHLEQIDQAVILDLACGTGRMSLQLLRQPWFRGRVRAVDFSAGMLDVFRQRIAQQAVFDRVDLEQADLGDWTPPAGVLFDAVVFMEASELVSGFDRLVQHVARSLKPGGLFLLTKPPDYLAWLFFGRQQTTRRFQTLLTRHGFTDVTIVPWQWRYAVVYATHEAAATDA